jgi:hypothetical protein
MSYRGDPNSIWRGANTSRTAFDKPWKWLLLPGVIIQWFLYMYPGRGLHRIVSDTRTARSPLMTYYYSAVFWIGLIVVGLFFFLKR